MKYSNLPLDITDIIKQMKSRGQYIGGKKKPSAERLERIKSELRHIGKELLAI